jgi:uncharacterized protein YbaP (TraB family)
MKKALVLAVSMLLLFSLVSSTVFAEEKGVSVLLNEAEIQFEAQSLVIEQGTTLVPVRPLFEQLGLSVDWNAESQVVTGTKAGFTIQMQIGNQTAAVNTQAKLFPAVPRIMNGSAYVPLRFISEAAGYDVLWDGSTQTIHITEAEASRGFLWKAQNGENTVYLLGSIHVADGNMYPLHDSIEEAFAVSDYLVVEADSTGLDPQVLQQLVVDKGTYQDGTTLQDHISSESYNQLNDILIQHGLTAEALNTFEPWAILSTIQYLQFAKVGYEAELGIDLHFINQAAALNKPIQELESVQFQLDMMDQISPELQEALLQETLDEYQHIEEMIHEMGEMWKNGDEETLLAITEESANNAELNKIIFDDRNGPMADKIEIYLNDTTPSIYFVVVGAGHMVGDTGIIKQLQEKGFTITRQ